MWILWLVPNTRPIYGRRSGACRRVRPAPTDADAKVPDPVRICRGDNMRRTVPGSGPVPTSPAATRCPRAYTVGPGRGQRRYPASSPSLYPLNRVRGYWHAGPAGGRPLEARSHTTGVIEANIAKIKSADFAMECATDMPDLEQKKLEWYQPRYAHSHPTAALSSLTIVFSCSSYHACSHSGRFKSGRKNPEAKT